MVRTVDGKEWVLRKTSSEDCSRLVRALNIHPLTARILVQRGIRDPEEASRFLDPALKHMHDPFTMKDMMSAVGEVLKAIERGQRIVIHGDYDVDGVCSVSVLYSFLTDVGANVHYYVPTRDADGYGLNTDTVRRLHGEGTGLIITTDCGISNVEEIKLANELGMRVIVVDHHTIPDTLPPARAILNPLQRDCQFPFKHLAAVGVTFNFVVAIRAELRKRGIFRVVPEPDLKRYLDLVALGTIADVVPLVDENRLFARMGLEVLAGRRRAGVQALMDRAAVEVGPVTARTVSFRLAPRLNAAGRMGDASICVELLTTRDYGLATELASKLEAMNAARQDEERGILEEAVEQAAEQVEQERRILVVSGQRWHRGVLGIVASRIMEQFHRPAILMGIDEDGIAKGSARSIQGINLIDALREVDELLATYGGHSAAAGLSLHEEHLSAFRERLHGAVGELIGEGPMPRPRLELDGTVDLREVDASLVDEIARLAPFGHGNPEPVLLARNAVASHVRVIGSRHLRARFRDRTGTVEGFGFSMGDAAKLLEEPVALAFVPKRFIGRSGPRLEIQLKGIRCASDDVPDRIESID